MTNLSQQIEQASKKLPKYIETELGTEKLCVECQEYWPLDDEFWFSYRQKPKKDGSRGIGYEAACKCCYDIRYRPQKIKGTYKVKSHHEKAAA